MKFTRSICPAGGQHESIVAVDYRSEMLGVPGNRIVFRVWLKPVLSFWDTVVLGKEETEDKKAFSITLCRKCSVLFGSEIHESD